MIDRRPQQLQGKDIGQDGQALARDETPRHRLDRVVMRARAALFWEKLWRALLMPGLIGGVFLCLSFAGFWLEVGRTWRMLGVAVLGSAFAASLVPLVRLRWPSRKQALARIDSRSGLAHRPASGLEDSLANPDGDLATRALWALHLRRIEKNIAFLHAGAPSPGMPELDRYALRAVVLIALVACAFLAGPEKYARVAAAFDWHGGSADTGGFRVDAWIDPPSYVGKAPVLLNLAAAAKDSDSPLKVEVPVGSTVIIRAAGGALRVATQGALEPLKDEKSAPAESAKAAPAALPHEGKDYSEQRLALRGDARLELRRGNAFLASFALVAIADMPPRIQLTDAPRSNLRGSLTLSYKISDDYGVTGAQADFKSPVVETGQHAPRSLVDPPRLPLNLALGAGGLGEAETTGDLSDHPWAGARVTMTLSARDEGGNEGKSDPIEVVLPQKPFTKPIARALVELRRDLVLFPEDRGRVETALEALLIAPDIFGTTAGVYLGLDVAAKMLHNAQTDPQILAVADYLWSMALEIENGDLSVAERELRAAEQKLREALQRGAPDEEIAKLTSELRAAMDKFLKEFAEKMMREQSDRNVAEQPPDARRAISPKDLQSMLDRMQDMARAGDRESAQKMLEKMQNLLENLRMGRHKETDPARREMSRALGELDKMMRDQQDLRDETHQSGQAETQDDETDPGLRRRTPPDAQRHGKAEDGQQHPGDQALQQRQKALRDRLEQLQKRMQQAGRGQPGLDDADGAMSEAERALGDGERRRDDAVDAQGRALEAMRREAQNLAEQLQQGEGQPGQEAGNEDGLEGQLRAQGDEDADPLGRPLSTDPLNPWSRFDPLGVPAAQRAQRVLEELRRRLADPSRPREEMDYFERLLKRY